MRSWSGDRGAALVEMALLTPLLLLLVFGIVDLGRALYTHVTIQEAAQEGALYGSFAPGDHIDTVARVVDSVNNPTLVSGEVTVMCVPVDPLDPADSPDIVVRVSHDLDLITPISNWFGGTVTLASEVTATIFAEEACDPTP
jgi:hypothetical protein